MKFSQKQANILFAVIMVGIMTFIITGLSTFINSGFNVHFFPWMRSWIFAYVVALPIMMLLSPPLRKFLVNHS